MKPDVYSNQWKLQQQQKMVDLTIFDENALANAQTESGSTTSMTSLQHNCHSLSYDWSLTNLNSMTTQ